MAAFIFLLVLIAGAIALGMARATILQWAVSLGAAIFAWQAGFFHGVFHTPAPGFWGLLAWLPVAALAALSVPGLRRKFVVEPVFRMIKGVLPKVSDTEQQALDAGTVGFDAELFSGTPDWLKPRAVPPIVLSSEERAFLDGPTDELCRIIDHWAIRHTERRIPDHIWDFVKR